MGFSCVNRNAPEYSKLKVLSGMSDNALSFRVFNAMRESKTGLYPTIERISSDTTKSLLKETGSKLINDSIYAKDLDINNVNLTHRDLIVEPLSSLSDSWHKITHKATILNSKPKLDVVINNSKIVVPNNPKVAINLLTSNLEKRLGITVDILSEEDFHAETGKINANGAIKGGKILLNSKNATDTTKMHELLHILVGPMKFTNPELFNRLAQVVETLPDLGSMENKYKHLTQLDILEELIVEGMARYLTDSMSEEGKAIFEQQGADEFLYEMAYILDTTLDTTSAITSDELKTVFQNPLSKIFLEHNDTYFKNMLSYGEISRTVANVKSDLMKRSLLEENCI